VHWELGGLLALMGAMNLIPHVGRFSERLLFVSNATMQDAPMPEIISEAHHILIRTKQLPMITHLFLMIIQQQQFHFDHIVIPFSTQSQESMNYRDFVQIGFVPLTNINVYLDNVFYKVGFVMVSLLR
jgi:hypothetical protein